MRQEHPRETFEHYERARGIGGLRSETLGFARERECLARVATALDHAKFFGDFRSD